MKFVDDDDDGIIIIIIQYTGVVRLDFFGQLLSDM